MIKNISKEEYDSLKRMHGQLFNINQQLSKTNKELRQKISKYDNQIKILQQSVISTSKDIEKRFDSAKNISNNLEIHKIRSKREILNQVIELINQFINNIKK